MFEKVLFAVDFSPYTERLLACAGELTQAGMRELIMLYVVDSKHAGMAEGMMKAYAEDQLSRLSRSVKAEGLEVRNIIASGAPAREIVELARNEAVSLIYLGAHGKGYFERLVTGSVSNKVLKLADRPVLVHKCRVHEKDEGYACENVCELLFEKVLVTTDFSDYAESIRPLLEEMIASCCDDITLLHVQDEDDEWAGALETVMKEERAARKMEKLRELASCLEPRCRMVETRLERGSPVSTIIRVAEEIGASLIVVGALGHRRLAEKLIGGVAESVVNHSEVPVLVVRTRS
ncbi:MAG: universal stress protein [Actinomycetota bacterium]